jgi:hypothetical protein
MNYTLKKITAGGLLALFVLIGLGFVLSGDLGSALFGVFFASIALYIQVPRLRMIAKFQKKTYQWYKATHPLNVDGNRVTCFSCGSGHINVRSLMNHTYHRDHFCAQCGTTLYFSPEAK